MWNRDYHLRRTKFVVYQLAMIFCVCSESIGTAALSSQSHKNLPLRKTLLILRRVEYVDQQQDVERLHPPATVHNDDFVGAASYNIFVGIYVATIFGSAFFFDLFWPERRESSSVRFAWKVCSILACVVALADATCLTVIVAKHSGHVAAPNELLQQIALQVISPPLSMLCSC